MPAIGLCIHGLWNSTAEIKLSFCGRFLSRDNASPKLFLYRFVRLMVIILIITYLVYVWEALQDEDTDDFL